MIETYIIATYITKTFQTMSGKSCLGVDIALSLFLFTTFSSMNKFLFSVLCVNKINTCFCSQYSLMICGFVHFKDRILYYTIIKVSLRMVIIREGGGFSSQYFGIVIDNFFQLFD